MARLSVNDLNNLSGVSDVELDKVKKLFRKAHTKVFNDINGWKRDYANKFPVLKSIEGSNTYHDSIVYKVARELYYSGSLLLDDIDLFEEYTIEYQSVLTKLMKNNDVRDVRILLSLVQKERKVIIKCLSDYYGLYSEAYKRLNEEEEYE